MILFEKTAQMGGRCGFENQTVQSGNTPSFGPLDSRPLLTPALSAMAANRVVFVPLQGRFSGRCQQTSQRPLIPGSGNVPNYVGRLERGGVLIRPTAKRRSSDVLRI